VVVVGGTEVLEVVGDVDTDVLVTVDAVVCGVDSACVHAPTARLVETTATMNRPRRKRSPRILTPERVDNESNTVTHIRQYVRVQGGKRNLQGPSAPPPVLAVSAVTAIGVASHFAGDDLCLWEYWHMVDDGLMQEL